MNTDATQGNKTTTVVKVAAAQSFDTETLILSHQREALLIAKALLRKWGAWIPEDELTSVAALALCEAARGFDPSRNVRFTSYYFNFLRGLIIKTLCAEKKWSDKMDMAYHSQFDASNEEGQIKSMIEERMTEEEQLDPEDMAAHVEITNRCKKALMLVPDIEREIVVRVHVLGFKVTRVAKDLGYSRGHVSALRRKAFGSLREELADLKEAA